MFAYVKTEVRPQDIKRGMLYSLEPADETDNGCFLRSRAPRTASTDSAQDVIASCETRNGACPKPSKPFHKQSKINNKE